MQVNAGVTGVGALALSRGFGRGEPGGTGGFVVQSCHDIGQGMDGVECENASCPQNVYCEVHVAQQHVRPSLAR